MSNVSSKPSAVALWFTVLGIVGGFLLFAVIMYVVYLPSRVSSTRVPAGMTVEDRNLNNLLTPAERKARLTALQSFEAEELHAYRWIDQGNGIVRLPVDRAIELTIPELKAGQEGN